MRCPKIKRQKCHFRSRYLPRQIGTEPEAVQDRGVNQFVEDLLQLDYRSFTTSVFAQQKELAKLSSFQPEERRQSINRLINIDQIDKARDKVRRDKNEQTAFLNGKKSNIKDIPELKAQKEKLLPRQKELATANRDNFQRNKRKNQS